jgi:putative nucleotidyltransferase with HDIG domain
MPRNLRDLLASNLSIPTLPSVARRLNALVADPAVGTREIGALVARDAPLAAKVMRIANSALYGLAAPCLSTEHASTVLGVRVLRNIVLQVSVMSRYEHLSGAQGIDVPALWTHAIRAACVSAEIGRRARVTLGLAPDELYACGLLHDIGRVVLLDGLGDEYVRLVREAEACGADLQDLERAWLGYDHADVGAWVAERWGLPEAARAAIAGHHGLPGDGAASPAAAVVAQADALTSSRIPVGALDEGFAERFRIDAAGAAAVLELARSEPEPLVGDTT